LPLSTRFNTEWTTVYQYEYPENFQEIKHGFGYWRKPIEWVGEPQGVIYWQDSYGLWNKYDTKHPKCSNCGRFLAKNKACTTCN